MNTLGEKLCEILKENGAVLIGYGDVSDIIDSELKTGVSIAIPMPKDMVRSIEKDVTVIGNGNKVEIWATDVWDESINNLDPDLIAGNLCDLGIMI